MDRREQIIDTALELIGTIGLAALTHRRIAEAANIPLGSTTYYFDSLGHLIQEAFLSHILNAEKHYSQAAQDWPVSNVESFVDHLVHLTQSEFEDGRFLVVEYELTMFAARDPEVARALKQWDEKMVASLASSLESIGVSNPFEAGQTMLHLMRGHEIQSLSLDQMDTEGLRKRLTLVVEAYLSRH